jgi:hypothetical protein
MSSAQPNLISVLHDRGHCLGFLRSAGPRGFTAYDANGHPLGLFSEKQAAVHCDLWGQHWIVMGRDCSLCYIVSILPHRCLSQPVAPVSDRHFWGERGTI